MQIIPALGGTNKCLTLGISRKSVSVTKLSYFLFLRLIRCAKANKGSTQLFAYVFLCGWTSYDSVSKKSKSSSWGFAISLKCLSSKNKHVTTCTFGFNSNILCRKRNVPEDSAVAKCCVACCAKSDVGLTWSDKHGVKFRVGDKRRSNVCLPADWSSLRAVDKV